MLLFILSMTETPEDKNKVEELYYKYRKLMKYIAFNILHDEDIAEDAVAEAFMALIKHLDCVGDIDSDKTKSFIYTVTKNVAVNMRKKMDKNSIEAIEDYIKYNVSEYDTFKSVYVRELLERIEKLPDIYREVLELKLYYEMSDGEIAKLLYISNSTVRKRLERARSILKERGEVNV